MATEAVAPHGGAAAGWIAPRSSGVLVREIINFSSYWRSTTFSSTVEPTIYLLAFGFGFGSLVSTVGGYDYVDFVGTGTVATAVLFSSVFPAMFGTFVKYKFQRTYDAILAAPGRHRGARHRRGAVARDARLGLRLRADARRDALRPGAELGHAARPVHQLRRRASAGRCAGISIAGFLKGIENFNYVTSAVITPLFLLAGTFFPIAGLPDWVQAARRSSTRSTTASSSCATRSSACRAGSTSGTSAFLVVFGLAMWRARRSSAMQRKLID